MNILISSVGIRGYLVKYFKEIPNVKVYACDISEYAPALYDADEQFILSNDIEFQYDWTMIDKLINICNENKIDGFLTLNDIELNRICAWGDKLREIDTELILSNNDVLRTMYDKYKLYEKYPNNSPMTYIKRKYGIVYPCIIKERYGSASLGFKEIYSKKHLKQHFIEGTHIIQELVNGDEYNAQVFNNECLEPVSVYLMKKIRMRAGETDKAISVYDEELIDWVKDIANESGVYGPMDIDSIVSDGTPYLLDINPRFGGGYPMAHALGADFPKKVIELLQGKRLKEDFKKYPENVVMMKQHEIVIK